MKQEIIREQSFQVLFSFQKIEERIIAIAQAIDRDYADKQPIIVGVLNGSFRFVADLVRHLQIHTEITFIRVSSYDGTVSTGNVQEVLGLQENIEGKDVIIVEDIVDTGTTLCQIVELLQKEAPASLKVATLLHKPAALQKEVPLDYVGFEIPNLFVVGYGLDYDGLGRSLNDLYVLSE